MIRVGIFGATGYTGYELIKLLANHPQASVVFATSRRSAGQKLSDLYPCWHDVLLVTSEQAMVHVQENVAGTRETRDSQKIDVAFFCLPHGESMPVVKRVRAAGVRAIDLSADFRLRDAAVYQRWYKKEHVAPELLSQAVYGLPEVYRQQIADAQLVANPGCYPTSVLLALYPLVVSAQKFGAVEPQSVGRIGNPQNVGRIGNPQNVGRIGNPTYLPQVIAKMPLVRGGHLGSPRIIVDSKSGVSGAGRKLSLATHFVEVNENFLPYSVGRAHRHLSEMEQELRAWADVAVRVIFAPHLLPVARGILSTVYVTLKAGWSVERLVNLYRQTYIDEPFIRVLPAGKLASLSHVTHTNHCAISFAEAGENDFIVVSAIDNLLKGASGQAVQNMNLMFGLDETMGLL